MGTTTTTNTSNQYNPNAMNAYNMFQSQNMGYLSQLMSNPLGNSFFKNQLAQSMAHTNQIGQRSNANVLQNMRAGGGILSNSAGFMAGALNRNNLTNSLMQGNAFNSALNSALQNRNFASSSMAAYQPLQTGQNSTQSTGGLGTWLPQLAGAAMSMAMPGLGSMMGGGSFSSGYSNPYASSSMSRYSPTSGSMSGTTNPFSFAQPVYGSPYGQPAQLPYQ